VHDRRDDRQQRLRLALLGLGKTSDNVLELEVVTYDGTILTVGPMTRAELDHAIAEGGERGRTWRPPGTSRWAT
jgi:hypothetical protein